MSGLLLKIGEKVAGWKIATLLASGVVFYHLLPSPDEIISIYDKLLDLVAKTGTAMGIVGAAFLYFAKAYYYLHRDRDEK